MSDLEAIRAKLTHLDRLRATGCAAETARSKIRLSGQPVVRKGLLGFLRNGVVAEDEFFTEAETAAIYDALSKVRDDCKHQADQLEREVTQ